MILTCPACSTRYVVNPALFAERARKVKCARCGHQWLVEPPQIQLPPLDFAEPLAEIPPIPEGSSVPALPQNTLRRRRIIMLVSGLTILALLAAAMFFGGRMLAAPWQSFITTIEDFFYKPPPLELVNVRSEQRRDAGAVALVVTGEVHNSSKDVQIVPELLARALNSEQKVLESWRISPDRRDLSAGESTNFTSSLRNPPQGISEISITIGTEDDK